MGIKFSRLFVVLLIVAIPAYIVYEFLAYPFTLSWLPESWRSNSALLIISEYVNPVLFCIAWLYIMIVLATHIANTIDIMKEESNFISIHYMFFLGINALVLFFIFLIPLITPVIAPIAYASMMFKFLTQNVDDFDTLDAKTKKFVKSMCFLVGAIVFLFSLLLIPESLAISLSIFNEFMARYLDDLYYFFKALGVAISMGTVAIMYKKGVKEAEGQSVDYKGLITPGIIAFEILMVAFLLFLNYEQIPLINILYSLGPIFSGIAFLINLRKGSNRKKGEYGNKMEIFLWIVLLVLIIVFSNETFRIAMVIVTTIFFVIYFIGFLEHPKHQELA